MSDTAEKKTRRTWTHADIGTLMRAFAEQGGASGARAALHGDFTVEQIDQKLESLGLVKLTNGDKQHVEEFLETLKLHDHPNLIIDYALAELRKARKS